jgi:hypothetical protein
MERHPDEDELVALALGTLPGEPTDLLRHLATCPACRSAYDDLSAAVDSVLPAAPAVAAPAGFDARVLDRPELRPSPAMRRLHPRRLRGPRRPEPHRASSAPRRSRRVPLLVAAAAALGIGLGAVGSTLLDDGPAPPRVTAGADGALLLTGAGTTVGTVEPSYAGAAHVVVMQVTSGQPGTHYTCRLLLKDGTSRDAGQWWTPPSGRATWIAYGSADDIDRVQLVTDDGQVWSTADLPS